MKIIRYIIRKIKNLNLKKLFFIISKIQKKTNKLFIFILFDIILSALILGCGYMDYFEFEFYLLTYKQRKTFITSYINNEIVKKYNDKKYWYKFKDKVTFNKLFNKYIKREYLYLKESSFEDFKKFIKNKNKIVVKPIDLEGGKGVKLINIDKKTDIKKLYSKLIRNNQLLVEEFIIQHKDMSKLYDKSVNTLRIISFITNNNNVVILKSILKIGNKGYVDNFSDGGMYTFTNEKGKVIVPAIDEEGNIFKIHPLSKTNILGFQVPHYNKIIKLIKEAALIVPEVRYVGWDVAITKNGPLLIEGNEFSGIYQIKPSFGYKEGDLTNYRKYMDI